MKNRKNIRWRIWDYRWDGAYFITICTKDREHYFGSITNKEMTLSKVGDIANALWYEIPNHAKHITLDAFVVMPNHIHGILILKGNAIPENNTPKTPDQTRFQNIGKNSISSIVGSYKSAVTKNANRLNLTSGWQIRFHDHVIRNEKEFHKIQQYIRYNIVNWESDRFFREQ